MEDAKEMKDHFDSQVNCAKVSVILEGSRLQEAMEKAEEDFIAEEKKFAEV